MRRIHRWVNWSSGDGGTTSVRLPPISPPSLFARNASDQTAAVDHSICFCVPFARQRHRRTGPAQIAPRPDLWAAHQQLLAQLALVYDLPEARAEIDALYTVDAASYLSHRGNNSLYGERQAYIAMTRDFASTYADQFPGVTW